MTQLLFFGRMRHCFCKGKTLLLFKIMTGVIHVIIIIVIPEQPAHHIFFSTKEVGSSCSLIMTGSEVTPVTWIGTKSKSKL